MRVGTLVRIKQSENPIFLGELAIVVVKGTWSVDVHIINSNSSWQPRFAIEELEVLCR